MDELLDLKVRKTKKLISIRKKMAKAMAYNWATIPHFVQMVNANAKNLIKVKEELGVSYNDILIKAIANCVKKVPEVNSSIEDMTVTEYEDINVSVAVVTDAGLVVPVIRNTDTYDVKEIHDKVKELAKKAAEGTLVAEEIYGGTITISNLGFSEVENGTPVINSPQSALVFVGKIRKEPIVDENDNIVVGHLLGFSVAYDHRFIDGMTAQKFTSTLKKEIENITAEALMEKTIIE